MKKVEDIKDVLVKMYLNKTIKSFKMFIGPDGYTNIELVDFSNHNIEKSFKWHTDEYAMLFLKSIENDKEFNITPNVYKDIIEVINSLHHLPFNILRASIYNGKDFYITYKC